MFTCYTTANEILQGLYQWDANRTVFVHEEDAPEAPLFHFCGAGDKKALVVIPEAVEGGYTAAIPNVLLQRPEDIYLYLVSAEGGQVATEKVTVLPVEPRAKPDDYEYEEDSSHISLNVLYAQVESLLDSLQEQLSAAQSHRASTDNPHGVTAAQVGARAAAWMPTASEVGARPATWTPSASDVGAEPSGAAAAAITEHNTAADAHSDLRTAVAGKADRSVIVTATLLAASWAGTEAPYTYTLSAEGVTATSNQELLPATDITAAQLEALQAANITDGGQAADSITLKAYGDKPAIDLPVRLMKRGDM